VVSTPLKNMRKSVGIIVPNILWKNNPNVPVTTNQIWLSTPYVSLPEGSYFTRQNMEK